MTGQWSYPAEPVTDPAEALDVELARIQSRIEHATEILRLATEAVDRIRADLQR